MLGLAVFLLAANIIFSLCLYAFAKKRFSRERVLRDVEKELDLLYKDLQREIDNSISLVEDRTAALKSLIEAADKRILLAASEIEKREQAASFTVRPADVTPTEPPPDIAEDDNEEEAEAEEADTPAKRPEKRAAPHGVYTKRQIIAKAAGVDPQRQSDAASSPISAGPIKPEIPVRERVVMLARQDISPDEIAKILSIPQSEVDLILALDL